MPAPTVNFTVQSFTFGQVFTSTQANALQDNGEFVKQWLGASFVNSASQDHVHNGLDSAFVSDVASGVIGRDELETATGQVSTTGASNLTLPGGTYGFYPQTRVSSNNYSAQIATSNDGQTFATNIWISPADGTVFALQRYVPASPPYMIGDVQWGHFLFLLRNPSTGLVKAAYEAQDPPWAYNGPSHYAKDSVERIQAIPHPFVDYRDKDPAVDGLEITLVNLSEYNTAKWKADNEKVGKGILEDLPGKVNPGQLRAITDFNLPDIPGFTDKVKIRNRV